MAAHSRIVGGSTAKRVINCPGSVELVNQMPPQPSSKYADEGTLLHDIISKVLDSNGATPEEYLGFAYNDCVLTPDLIERKLQPALNALAEIDPAGELEYAVESRVGFGDFLPDVFGSTDLAGRIGTRAIILDWKFGDGVAVSAEENEQLMFYAAAAMRTPELDWVFDGAKDIELIIIQPPYVRRWVTTFERIAEFEKKLAMAVWTAKKPNAPLEAGSHCRWCAAKPLCPVLTGAVERALVTSLEDLDADAIADYLKDADLIEGWIADLRKLAHQMLENDVKVPGWKLVQKRATRQWADNNEAATYLQDAGVYPYEQKIITPAQAEKALKAQKKDLPSDLVQAVSTGSTLAPASDPRPPVLQIGRQMKSALSKLQ